MTEAKEPKWLYRLESTDPKKGLWYDANFNGAPRPTHWMPLPDKPM